MLPFLSLVGFGINILLLIGFNVKNRRAGERGVSREGGSDGRIVPILGVDVQ